MATEKRQVRLPRSLVGKARTNNIYSRYQQKTRVPNNSPSISNSQVSDVRCETVATRAVRNLVRTNGNVGSSIFSFVEIAKSGYFVQGFNTDSNMYNPEATEAAKTVLAQLDTVYNYRSGYADIMTVDATVETMLREAAITSFVGAELVLNRARLPEKIAIFPYESVEWKSRGDGTKYPVQIGVYATNPGFSGTSIDPRSGVGEVPLDFPTVWIGELHKDITKTYVTPMMEPAINSAVYYQEFVEDMRRAVRSNGHSRLFIKLNSEKVVGAAPDEIRDDPAKLEAFLEDQRQLVQNVVEGLSPEEALVGYDTIEVDEFQVTNVKSDYTDLLTAISGMLATSLKSHPSILGLRLQGSQSLSNTESLVFLKIAKGLQRPVEDVMSRALTLAVRLFGINAYIKFKFKPINLRPDDELESFKTMRQQRTLEALSLGFLSDDEASEILGYGVKPEGGPKLSGTMFMNTGGGTMADQATVTEGAQERALSPDTPQRGGGRSN